MLKFYAFCSPLQRVAVRLLPLLTFVRTESLLFVAPTMGDAYSTTQR